MKLDISTTRKEKLKFLNDLKTGKTSLKDFQPPKFGDTWLSSDELTLENLRTGEVITMADFDSRCQKDGTIPITFK